MCNDIWYLGQESWAVYTEDSTVAEQLHKLDGIKMVAVYRHVKVRGIIAVQFTFCDHPNLQSGKSLLAKVCSVIGLDLRRVIAMKQRCEYIPYSRKYQQTENQLELTFGKKRK